ncbi:hypothetical protein [Amycolatopsis sp. YIM 10]|nr:hypothetical protein [Amycolatopsis sp. YIM 10]
MVLDGKSIVVTGRRIGHLHASAFGIAGDPDMAAYGAMKGGPLARCC